MKDMQRIEILFHEMSGRFDVFEERFDKLECRFDKLEGRFDKLEVRFDKLEGRFDKLEQRFDTFETEIRPMLARIPFIERKLDSIKVVVGDHSSALLNHESRINRLEHRPRLLRDGEGDA